MSVKRDKAGRFIAKKFKIKALVAVAENYGGLCRACGAEHGQIEPDARNYVCEQCGMKQVFGAQELILMGAVVL